MRKKDRGYSLIEVLIAFALLAVAVLPIMSMYPTTFKINQRATNVEEGARIATTLVDLIKARGYANLKLKIEEKSGDWVMSELTDLKSAQVESFLGELDYDNNMKGKIKISSKGMNLGDVKVKVRMILQPLDLELLTSDPNEEQYVDIINGVMYIRWENETKEFHTQFIITPIE